jgi:hypothetical protein
MGNLSLQSKVVALGVMMVALGVMMVAVLALSHSPSHGLVLGVLLAAFVFGGGLTFVIFRRLSSGVTAERLAELISEFKTHS